MGSHHGKTKTTTITQFKELHEAYKAMEIKGHTCQLATVHRKSTRLNGSLVDKKTVPTQWMVGVAGKCVCQMWDHHHMGQVGLLKRDAHLASHQPCRDAQRHSELVLDSKTWQSTPKPWHSATEECIEEQFFVKKLMGFLANHQFV